jgi:hypothetical protein
MDSTEMPLEVTHSGSTRQSSNSTIPNGTRTSKERRFAQMRLLSANKRVLRVIGNAKGTNECANSGDNYKCVSSDLAARAAM